MSQPSDIPSLVPDAARLQRYSTLEKAILYTITYGDIFDYPLTVPEIQRYLTGTVATQAEITATLAPDQRLMKHFLTYQAGFYLLADRPSLTTVRQERTENAKKLWPNALHYGQRIARTPFVRMVAVTGSLAVNNIKTSADIDYLIVTEPGRLWLCRALVILLVRQAARQGVILCPNLLVSQRALTFPDQSLYTAHEVAQMLPLAGLDVYAQMRQANDWVARFLPNAVGAPPAQFVVDDQRGAWQKGVEWLLRTPLGTSLEQWEMKRKVQRFEQQRIAQNALTEAHFSVDWCWGHFDGHRSRVLHLFAERWKQVTG